MTLTKTFKAIWWVDDGDLVMGAGQATEAAAEQDLVDAEAAAGAYTSFRGLIEVRWDGA